MNQSCIIEYECTYLLKYVPNDLKNYPWDEISDIYIPQNTEHPKLRMRKRGSKYEICKKYPVYEGDASQQHEFTIPITKEEFQELNENLQGKRARKHRYSYKYKSKLVEIDVYLDDLKGLILADVEFTSDQKKANFSQPDFCLADVTQEKVTAGGMLVGKNIVILNQF
ncbi:MAG TPA: hypothetical protein ENN28_03315 [Candidatus Uhrbacteria bacterium]|nr:hypothetical protein [Candidatus Uhrbacteria bacterium]